MYVTEIMAMETIDGGHRQVARCQPTRADVFMTNHERIVAHKPHKCRQKGRHNRVRTNRSQMFIPPNSSTSALKSVALCVH